MKSRFATLFDLSVIPDILSYRATQLSRSYETVKPIPISSFKRFSTFVRSFCADHPAAFNLPGDDRVLLRSSNRRTERYKAGKRTIGRCLRAFPACAGNYDNGLIK